MFLLKLGFHYEAEFILSQKGSCKLTHTGYGYFKDVEKNGTTSWRCDKRLSHQCKGKAQTRKIGEKIMVRARGLHNHLP